jgi:hypothetical protein
MTRVVMFDIVHKALELLQSMATFYCKYHLLEAADRRVVVDELEETHQSFMNTKKLIQQHTNIIKWRMEELHGHYDEWISSELVVCKKWRRHPAEELKQLLTRAENLTVEMDSLIMYGDPRRRSSGSWCNPNESSRKNSFNVSMHSMLPEEKK